MKLKFFFVFSIFFALCCNALTVPNDLNINQIDSLPKVELSPKTSMPSYTTRVASHYQFNTYSVSDGLSQSQVYAAIQDDKGNLLFGTQGGGISIFDGKDFRVLTTANGLTSNYIHCFFKTPKGAILIGTSEGLNLYAHQQITSIQLPNEPETIVAIEQLTENSFLVVGQKHVYQLIDSKLKLLDAIQNQLKGALTCAAVAPNGTIYIGGAQGLFSFRGNDFLKQFTSRNGLNNTAVQALTFDNTGLLWIGTYGNGINCLEGDSLYNANTFLHTEKAKVLALYCDKSNGLCVGTLNDGALRFSAKDSSVLVLNENCGLANNHVRCLVQDDWQHLWIGTSGGGVSKYAPNTFEFYDKKSGLPGNYVYALAADTSGVIWMSTSGNPGVTKYTNDSFQAVESLEVLADKKVKSLLHTQDGRHWFGTENDGIFIFEGAEYKQIAIAQGLQSNYVRKLVADTAGNTWIATVGGGIGYIYSSVPLAKLKVKMLDKADGLNTRRINDLLIAKDGAVWFASATSGIGKIEQFAVSQVIDEQSGLPSNRVNALCEDSLGNIWVGTLGNGLACLTGANANTIKLFSTKNGLHSSICYSLLIDAKGDLWQGSEKGVERIQLDASGNILGSALYSFDEGFLGVETTLHAAITDASGDNWFGTIKGLAKYNERAVQLQNGLPKLSIDEFSVKQQNFGLDTLLSTNWTLPFDSNSIGVTFSAISQLKPKSIVYRWRMIGVDSVWTTQSIAGNLKFSNLPAGHYRFEVQASTDNITWTESQLLSFSIAQPYWQKWWFFVLLALLLIGVIYTFSQWRIKRIKAKSKEKEKQWLLEKEVLELEQKALRLQMNPHFIFNALNSIQAMISENDTKTARYYLVKFSKLMRQVLESSQKQKISLENEIVTLQNYLAIEQFCHNNRFDFELVCDENVLPDEIEIPPIVLQPFIENAIIHGLATKPENGQLNIRFKLEKQTLVCVITDNGIGRAAAEKALHQRDAKHKSTALMITQERLDNLNQNKSTPSIEIIDLYHQNGAPKGTEVRVRIEL